MGYFLQKLAEAAEPEKKKGGAAATEKGGGEAGKTLRQRMSETWSAGKKRAGELWNSGTGKVKDYAQRAGETRVGSWVKNNPKKTIGGAAGTAAALGLFMGRNKIKRALGYGESEG